MVNVIQQAIEALEEAQTGLAWYRDRNPDQSDGSDDEAALRIERAIHNLRAAQEGDLPPLPYPALGKNGKGAQHTQAPTIYADPKAPHQTLTPEQRAIMEAIPMMQKASPWWASRQPGGGWIATRFNPSAPANTERLPKVGEFKSEKDANAAIAKATKEPTP